MRCHVAPCYWAMCCLGIGLYYPVTGKVSVQSASHVIVVQPSQLPHHFPYIPVTCHVTCYTATCRSKSRSYYTITFPCQHLYIPSVVRTTMFHPAIGPHHVRTTTCHLYSATCQICIGANSAQKR
jgi:hypothetical protein